jgi:hypothetical protein
MSFGCSVCLALEFASEDSLRALVVYQARQLDGLTNETAVFELAVAKARIAELEDIIIRLNRKKAS